MSVMTGVCTFSRKIFKLVKAAEIQRIFYNIPRKTTVENWKRDAPDDFIFSIKVFQGLTHSKTSPTWRRFRGKISDDDMNKLGNLNVNELTEYFMDTMIEFAKILDARFLIVQTPASFDFSQNNVERAKKFFGVFEEKLLKSGLKTIIGWEPRGKWLDNVSVIKDILNETERVVHVVDPFFFSPAIVREDVYFRLHGKPYLNYKYQYTPEDFDFLVKKVRDMMKFGGERFYIMFNNVKMLDDARRFEDYITSKI